MQSLDDNLLMIELEQEFVELEDEMILKQEDMNDVHLELKFVEMEQEMMMMELVMEDH